MSRTHHDGVVAMRSAEIQTTSAADTPLTAPTTLPPVPIIALNRIAHGISVDDLAHFNSLGATDEERLAAYVEEQIAPDTIDDSAFDARVAATNYATLDLTTEQLWLDYHRDYDGLTDASRPRYELQRLMLLRAVYSKKQLHTQMTDFWQNHFSVDGSQTVIRSMIMRFSRDVLETHALGNFRTMLEEVGKSPSMLYYLDNYTNSNAGPNENYARELFELHGLGEENYLGSGIRQHEVPGYPDSPEGYVDDDVYEATRCFTGWTLRNSNANPDVGNTGEFFYRTEWHDRFQKTVLGQFIPANGAPLVDGIAVFDAIAAHPGTARYICRKLCRRFVTDAPSETLVQGAADVFVAQQDAPDQLAQVMRFILNSADFLSNFGTKVRRPFDALAAFLRATNAEINLDIDYSDGNSYISHLNECGQALLLWPAPNGFPDVAAYWLNTASIFKRWRMLNAVARDDDGNGNYYCDIFSETPLDVRTAESIVDYWQDRLYSRDVTDGERQEWIDYMAAGHNPTYTLPLDTDSNTRDRLRSLVSLMALSPSYLVR